MTQLDHPGAPVWFTAVTVAIVLVVIVQFYRYQREQQERDRREVERLIAEYARIAAMTARRQPTKRDQRIAKLRTVAARSDNSNERSVAKARLAEMGVRS